MRILALSGSIRSKSTNKLLLLATKSCAPADIEIVIYEGISDLPYFNPDLDFEGAVLPAPVQRLRDALRAANAFLISTPEYAHGMPGVLKNALDWLVSGPEMPGKSIGLIYGSAGDASHAQAQLTEVLTTMSARVIPAAVLNVPGVRTQIDEKGEVRDDTLKARLRALVDALARGAKA